ncbi:bzip transcription factor family protein [Stylonychia lemnae]|uniref:Bzip transcription factor family protein n=1 Tax=Stylonychia lemnae TaxID=5949 RepID=A0A077ZRK6_STYLE|nr:bzip transcription factor family protein [Stylonychia lemnae]|eukprot:CDW72099.1 bzip transcription factor family protein [Stylonychia lemnae]
MTENFQLHQEPFPMEEDEHANIFKNTSYLLSLADDISLIEPQPSALYKNQLLANTDLVESPKNYMWTRQDPLHIDENNHYLNQDAIEKNSDISMNQSYNPKVSMISTTSQSDDVSQTTSQFNATFDKDSSLEQIKVSTKHQKEIFFVGSHQQSGEAANAKKAISKRMKKQESKVKLENKEQAKTLIETSIKSQNESSHNNSNSHQSVVSNSKDTMSCDNTFEMVAKLTKKKQKYLQEVIQDKNGTFKYIDDPIEYKRARKRKLNRESAVRSRQRKNCYQEDLEQKFERLSKMTKELSDQNTNLHTQNILLQKQLAYFEDVFAKSQLIGYDNFTQVGIKKNELDEFKRNLINKINATLSDHEQEMLDDNYSFENIPGSVPQKRTKKNEIGEFNLASQTSPISSGIRTLRLARMRNSHLNSGFQGQGFMFLAVMFCMMCCSSLMMSPSSTLKLVNMTQNSIAKSITNFDGRKLLFFSPQINQVQKTLNSKVDDEDVKMEEESDQSQKLGVIKYTEKILSGEYTYLTYMIMSTTCFFFWMTPNYHKIKSMFKSFSGAQKTAAGQKAKLLSQKSSMVTRSRAKNSNQ